MQAEVYNKLLPNLVRLYSYTTSCVCISAGWNTHLFTLLSPTLQLGADFLRITEVLSIIELMDKPLRIPLLFFLTSNRASTILSL